jgi:hypothetical protein
MTLGQLFLDEKITKDLLYKRQGESSYWDSAVKYATDNWDRTIEELSQKQITWAYKILEDVIEWRIERNKR